MGLFDWVKQMFGGPSPRFRNQEEYEAFKNQADKEIKEIIKQIPDTYLQEIPGTNWNTLEKSARTYSTSLSRLFDIISRLQKRPEPSVEENLSTMAHNHLSTLKGSHDLITKNIEAYEKNYVLPMKTRLIQLSNLLQNEGNKFAGIKAIDDEQLRSLKSMQESLAELEKDFKEMYKGLSFAPIMFNQLLGETPEQTKIKFQKFLAGSNTKVIENVQVSLEKIDKLILSEVKSIKSLYSRFRNRVIALEQLEKRKAA
jgi:hypothetical protein